MSQVLALPDDDTPASPTERAAQRSFLKGVVASSADCVKVLDLDGTLICMTEAGKVAIKVSDFNLIRGW